MRRAQLLAITVVLLTGCVVERSTYYKPVKPDNYFTPLSGGHALGFRVADGLGIHIASGTASGTPVRGKSKDQLDAISISFTVGDGHFLQIQSPIFEVVPADSSQSVPIKVSEVTRVDFVPRPGKCERLSVLCTERKVLTFPIHNRLEGGTRWEVLAEAARGGADGRADFYKWFMYELKLQLGQASGKHLSIKFPPVLLDGKPVRIPDIRFEYGTYTHIQPINT